MTDKQHRVLVVEVPDATDPTVVCAYFEQTLDATSTRGWEFVTVLRWEGNRGYLLFRATDAAAPPTAENAGPKPSTVYIPQF